MTSSNLIITLISFLGVITILGVNAGQDIILTQGLTNQSNQNLTVVNLTDVGDLNPPVCNYEGDIPLLSDFIWGADCTAQYVGYTFGLLSISFSDPWIMLIVVLPILVALGYLLVRELIRGSGGG